MPKKRHQTKYTKPPSIAPPTLRISSSSQASATGQNERSVNDILADMRRVGMNSNLPRNDAFPHQTPSLPPSISEILQLPETPAPRPRRLERRDANGRRIPPGPPPPRSWLSPSRSRHAPQYSTKVYTPRTKLSPLPGAFIPAYGSLIDMTLHSLVANWETQRDWNKFYLYGLQSRLRSALVNYVSKYHEAGISVADLRLILLGPSQEELAEYELDTPDPAMLNNDIRHLDLTCSVGRVMSLKALSELLFPAATAVQVEVQDSWDAPEPQLAPTALLPNLTHLSLATWHGFNTGLSWKQLLLMSSKLSGLTHLNLSCWPEPGMTPNSIITTMVSEETGRSFQYGGTSMYSHIIDGDWSEAISVLKRLSKSLYRLEYLDLTGCGAWYPALRKEADAELVVDFVDWARDWGNITVLRLNSGYVSIRSHIDDVPAVYQNMERERALKWRTEAQEVERRIRNQRAGQGHFITVDMDSPDSLKPQYGF